MNKIIILVLTSDTYPSYRNHLAQKNTWAEGQSENIKIYFYKAGNDTVLNNNDLIVKSGSREDEIGYKNYEALECVIKKEDFDFLYRTNTSSFINIKNLEDYINNSFRNQDLIYDGMIMSLKNKKNNTYIKFVSGSGILFSKKTIEVLIDNKNEYDHSLWEDVAIGELLNKNGIFPTKGKRYDIQGNIYKETVNLNHYHYRCRIDNHFGYPGFLEKRVLSELNYRTKNSKSFNKKYVDLIFFEICKLFYIQMPFWKIYKFLRNLFKTFLPKSLYNYLKTIFKNRIVNFQLRYFKK